MLAAHFPIASNFGTISDGVQYFPFLIRLVPPRFAHSAPLLQDPVSVRDWIWKCQTLQIASFC